MKNQEKRRASAHIFIATNHDLEFIRFPKPGKTKLDILATINVKIENSIFGSVLLSRLHAVKPLPKIQNWHSIKNLETTKVQTCSWLKLVDNQS